MNWKPILILIIVLAAVGIIFSVLVLASDLPWYAKLMFLS